MKKKSGPHNPSVISGELLLGRLGLISHTSGSSPEVLPDSLGCFSQGRRISGEIVPDSLGEISGAYF